MRASGGAARVQARGFNARSRLFTDMEYGAEALRTTAWAMPWHCDTVLIVCDVRQLRYRKGLS